MSEQTTNPTTAPGTTNIPVLNPWIWLVVFAPAVSIVLLPALRIPPLPPFAAADDPMVMLEWQLSLFFSPVFVIMMVLGWAGMIVAIVAAYRDWKLLTDAGLERPFHWAFIFLNLVIGPVYAIGRAIVVRQRTGRGMAVLWATIATLLVTITVAIVWTTVITIDIVNEILRVVAN